jgi:hypothetical protein
MSSPDFYVLNSFLIYSTLSVIAAFVVGALLTESNACIVPLV